MNRGLKGFLLIEALIATVLYSMVGSGLFVGLVQGIKAEQKIRRTFKAHQSLGITQMRLEKDLRNAMPIRDYPFRGSASELSFPMLTVSVSQSSGQLPQLSLVAYQYKAGVLSRTEKEISPSGSHNVSEKKDTLTDLKSLNFSFPFIDSKNNIEFKNQWPESPYFGIPSTVKIEIKTKEEPEIFQIQVGIPQGRWGHLLEEKGVAREIGS